MNVNVNFALLFALMKIRAYGSEVFATVNLRGVSTKVYF